MGRITLNRPKALNALDLGMIRAIAGALEAWQEDPGVHAVVVDAVGGRAFCAGGDIRDIRNSVLGGQHDAVETFFTAEYALNQRIARYKKPYIALIDGVCLGGGIGLSVHGSARVVSEHAQLAMPETQIGFFPDVGATFVLPRLRGRYGLYMALTGARVGGGDACWLGLATHFVPRGRMADLADALAEDGVGALTEAATVPPAGTFPALRTDIAPFDAGDVPGIFAALERAGTAWAADTLRALRALSPSALMWTCDIIRAGAGRTLEECLQAELELSRRATRHPDFAEGVRAMVVDKDRSPRWSPARLEDVVPLS